MGFRGSCVPLILAFLCPSTSLAAQAPAQVEAAQSTGAPLPENLSLLLGKKVLVGQMRLCVPNTYNVKQAYRGQPARVVGFRRWKMNVPTEGLTPAMRTSVENMNNGRILLLQFEDGTKLDTCVPETAKELSSRIGLAPGQTIATGNVTAYAELPAVTYTAHMSESHPAAPVFSPHDFPSYLEKADVRRLMFIRIDVLRNGAPLDCEVEISSGDKALDRYTCELIIKRAHFSSATWPDGSVAYGVIRSWLSWAYNFSGPPGSVHGDLDVTVNQMPKGIRSPHSELLLLAVDETGHIEACEADTPGLSKTQKSDPELAQLACGQLKKTYTPRPPIVEGHPKRSVQTAIVQFSAQPK